MEIKDICEAVIEELVLLDQLLNGDKMEAVKAGFVARDFFGDSLSLMVLDPSQEEAARYLYCQIARGFVLEDEGFVLDY